MSEKKYRAIINMTCKSGCILTKDQIEEFIEVYKDNFEEVKEEKTAEESLSELLAHYIANMPDYYSNEESAKKIIELIRQNDFLIVKQTEVEELAEKIFLVVNAGLSQSPVIRKLVFEPIKQVLSSAYPKQPESIAINKKNPKTYDELMTNLSELNKSEAAR